jgi:protocatechuate 3,4-dioxygenase alpha subunit
VSALTPFQTVGPYFHLGLYDGRAEPAPATATKAGQSLTVGGRVLDGAGAGIREAVLEFWAPGWTAITRVFTDDDGRYQAVVARPQPRREADGAVHAAHLVVRVLGRGILTEYLTRIYFAGDEHLAADPVLQHVPAARRASLIAIADAGDGHRFDVVVQGERETVFFDA